jgi:PAT family acetyl-CoA transporter-like MFS transporter 1
MLVLSQYVDVLIGPDPDRAGNATLANSVDNTTNILEIQNDRNQSSSTSSSPDSVFKPDIVSLTIAFFFLTFFAATQDVAVDGWALTMLKPKNVGYAATCNSVGQTTGWCLGYILYTVLDDANVIDLSQFLIFWGIVFIVTTAIIAIFKKEKNQQLAHKNDDEEESGETPEEEPDLGIIETYKIIWKIICHPLVPPLILFLFTSGIGFTASESITN